MCICPLRTDSLFDLQGEMSDFKGQSSQVQAELLEAQSQVVSHRKELDAANKMREQHKVPLSTLLHSVHHLVTVALVPQNR